MLTKVLEKKEKFLESAEKDSILFAMDCIVQTPKGNNKVKVCLTFEDHIYTSLQKEEKEKERLKEELNKLKRLCYHEEIISNYNINVEQTEIKRYEKEMQQISSKIAAKESLIKRRRSFAQKTPRTLTCKKMQIKFLNVATKEEYKKEINHNLASMNVRTTTLPYLIKPYMSEVSKTIEQETKNAVLSLIREKSFISF